MLAVMLLLTVGIYFPVRLNALAGKSGPEPLPFEKAVALIKKYETLHQPRHWPFVGYGHKVLPGEKFNRKKALAEAEADALLRKDLKKLCKLFRSYGKDSLLLATLAYNIGQGAVGRSTLAKKLREGDRNIRDSYISHCRYRGKVHKQIRQRRIDEFEALFVAGPGGKNVARGYRGRKAFLKLALPPVNPYYNKLSTVTIKCRYPANIYSSSYSA